MKLIDMKTTTTATDERRDEETANERRMTSIDDWPIEHVTLYNQS